MLGEVLAVVAAADIEGRNRVAVGRGEGLSVGEGDGEEEVYRCAVCVESDIYAGANRASGVCGGPNSKALVAARVWRKASPMCPYATVTVWFGRESANASGGIFWAMVAARERVKVPRKFGWVMSAAIWYSPALGVALSG